ncbi:MAG TPA: zinc-dependent metalloprotease, partial [Rhodothermales bacterium]|nr:zinc-dependent metalloprotease [Rhodothermales bacterium]
TVLTYDAAEPPSNSSTGTISLSMNHSMVMLPEDKMKPRRCDNRVGYFNVEMTDYGLDTQKATEVCYITRWRLEPSDMEAFQRGELVEPKKPIVYYIDPATPEQWRPYIKQGVDDWNVAFEAAGFKNAIRAADPPTLEEDPEFSPEDARYSVIRYFPSDVQNAYGPHVHDPRTGEILESDIGWFHNVMNLLRNWYFIQTAPSNPGARGVEFTTEEMGELVRFVSAHEVGHTLGLPHNWGSSAAIPVDSLRSPTYTAEHGTAPSIMDYARFNYIAQPDDGVTNFMPRIGIYDKWAIEWGYKPIPEANTAKAERPTLNEWIKEHADDPEYWYGRTSASFDPRSQNEDLGDDPVLASELGIANLQRIIPQLVNWTYREGENYDDLEELYGQVAGQWSRYMGHVARNIGGVYETYKSYEQDGVVFEPVPEERQEAAMAFLQEHAFQRPDWLLNTDVLNRIQHAGALDEIRQRQVGIVNMVLDPQRLARMIEAEVMLGDEAYTLAEMMEDLRTGLWSELRGGGDINPFRRSLQRGYVERLEYLMTEEVEPPPARFRAFIAFTPVDVSQSDIRPYVRGELTTLRREVAAAVSRTSDRATQLHLRDTLVRIDDILEGEDD